MELLRGVAKSKPAESAIWLRNPSGRDARPTIYDAIYHQRRIVDNMAAMLGDAVTAFNYKMITKEASVLNRIKGDGDTGNHWVWHQDYAYWYYSSPHWTSPDMGNCSIAVDRAHVGNGCLQFLRGSHRLGRLDHGQVSQHAGEGVATLLGHTPDVPTFHPDYRPPEGVPPHSSHYGADPTRVAAALKRSDMEVVDMELEIGDAVFWHANLLHRSGANALADEPRWALINCYNVAANTAHTQEPLEGWDVSVEMVCRLPAASV